MDENLQEDWLDARLREEASYVDDAGFTAGVIQKLPAQRVRRSYRAAILLAVTALASVIVYLLAGNSGFIAEAVTRFIFMPLSLIYLAAIGAGLLLMGFGVGAAMSKTGGQRLR
jgi:hypothetical protein